MKSIKKQFDIYNEKFPELDKKVLEIIEGIDKMVEEAFKTETKKSILPIYKKQYILDEIVVKLHEKAICNA